MLEGGRGGGGRGVLELNDQFYILIFRRYNSSVPQDHGETYFPEGYGIVATRVCHLISVFLRLFSQLIIDF